MAEIEFKRRGTPLWAVLLALVVIAGIVWALLRRGHAPAAAPADTTAVRADSAVKTAPPAAPAPVTAPPLANGATAKLRAWVDSSKTPSDAARQPAYVGDGLSLLGAALQERVPLAGVQANLVRAMADTLHMPNLEPRRYLDATQAAFFAVAYALRQTNAGSQVGSAATTVRMTAPLAQQSKEVRNFFTVAARALRDSIKTQTATPPKASPAAPPNATPNGAPNAPAPKQPAPGAKP